MNKPIIKINRKTCISCGTCVSLAPKTFELDKNLVAKVKDGPLDNLKTIQDAASNCAVSAITIKVSED